MCLFEVFAFFPVLPRLHKTARQDEAKSVSRVKEGKHFNRVRWCFTKLSLIQFHGITVEAKSFSSHSELLMARLLKSQSEAKKGD
jgi:hypothetical protein